ncbi:MAG: glycerate kinase [Nitrospinae bacterium]|nr:glycerate kinase [Nitrospinota bacterium]
MGDEATRRGHARAIFDAGVAAADPAEAVRGSLRLDGDILSAGPGEAEVCRVDLAGLSRVVLIGAGKAAAPMARAVEEILGDRLDEGVIVVKYGHGGEALSKTRVIEAGHPVPDKAGVEGAEAIISLVDGCGRDDLIICCLSGGGSALLPAPAGRITLNDKQALTERLLESGAAIGEINAIRKHCSRIKGGQLARRAAPARVVSLMLSDVVGDRADTIASGPLAPDETTFADCLSILERYRLSGRIPASVANHLKEPLFGKSRKIPENPKADDPAFANIKHYIVASNLKSLEAASERARGLGYRPIILSASVQGEAREVARALASVAREAHPVSAPACLLAGGEPTVTLAGAGSGGRCQELALAGAIAIAGCEDIVLLAAGTDGSDGPTDAAGAIADGKTVARGYNAGLDAQRHLDANDAYPFFQALEDLVITGPTLTNVMDVICILVGPLPESL